MWDALSIRIQGEYIVFDVDRFSLFAVVDGDGSSTSISGTEGSEQKRFTDHADIEHIEAVYHLAELGILAGYPDGKFYPKQSVTRAEAAVIIARMMLGSADTMSLPVGSTGFRDVEESHWANACISYCVSQRFINGYGDGRYGPNDSVTGVQMAALLLNALGYGVYTGSDWSTNAIVDGLRYSILTAENASYTYPATREQVALYVQNAMKLR